MRDANRGAVYEKMSPSEAYKMMKTNNNVIVIDVRSEDEYNSGHIRGALSLPLNELEEKFNDIISDKNKIILVYCRSGIRSEDASRRLIELGCSYVYDIGGLIYWPYEIVI